MVSAGNVIRASDVSVQACRVTRATSQAITDATNTAVAFTTEDFDTDSMHSTVTNNSRITINTAGIYIVGFGGQFESQNYDRTFVFLRVNGSTEIAHVQSPSQGAGIPQRLNINHVCQFDVGDYVEAIVFQDNSVGATRNLEVSSDRSPIFYAARLGS